MKHLALLFLLSGCSDAAYVTHLYDVAGTIFSAHDSDAGVTCYVISGRGSPNSVAISCVKDSK